VWLAKSRGTSCFTVHSPSEQDSAGKDNEDLRAEIKSVQGKLSNTTSKLSQQVQYNLHVLIARQFLLSELNELITTTTVEQDYFKEGE
jgi:hypothetical protein